MHCKWYLVYLNRPDIGFAVLPSVNKSNRRPFLFHRKSMNINEKIKKDLSKNG